MKKKPKFKIDFVTGICCITVIASAVMIVKGIMLQPVISANNKKAVQISEDIDYENQRRKEIDAVMQKAGTDEYIEKIAREKLGMIKADEIVFVDISGQ